jgi:hypothetical protein|tara:strand:+ start:404 stop:874 length:471 start_codon:yes stop_codon:yes gene_type:complete
MASYKDYKSISAARKAGSLYYEKNGKKMLAVTKEQLDSWKKKNKGKYKGSALTAYANAKGKNISGAPSSSPRPKARPGSAPQKKPMNLSGNQIKKETLVGSRTKADIEKLISEGKEPMKLSAAAKKKKTSPNKKGKPMSLSGNFKGGMAKRKKAKK